MLTDVVVIDLSRALAGPHAAMTLGDLGARVIKVESPGAGDESRSWGPPFVGEDGHQESTYFLSCNRNKESVTADLKSEEGCAFLRDLLRRADVVVENFRPGVMDRLGFSNRHLHDINPRLVICSITGFGHDGPEGGRPGYDQIAQGEAGLMSLTGPEPGQPTRVGVPIGDLLAGMNAVIGVLGALNERERTGLGRVVRTSLLSSIVGVHAFQGTSWTVGGRLPEATGNHHPSICPYGLFDTQSGPIQIACGNDQLWRALSDSLGIDEPAYATNAARVVRRSEVIATLEVVLKTESADHWLDLLARAGVPAGKVRGLDEVYAWEQTRSQGLLIDVQHSTVGRITLPGPPIRLDDNAFAGAHAHHTPPPTLGQHDESVRAWLREEV